jgi:DNA-binding protein YbaB
MTAPQGTAEQPAAAANGARSTRYAAEAALVARNVATIERVQQTLRDLRKKWASIDVHMESADGDVQLSVNHHGRLMSLSLAPGCTTRYTNEALEQVISTTLQAAVADAYAEREVIEQHTEEAALEAAKLLDNLQ